LLRRSGSARALRDRRDQLRYRAEALGAVSVPIPGTRRASRVEENLGSLSVTLTAAQLTALDAAGAAVAGNRSDDLTWVSAGRE
jgi:diketogulonate reductase-like aldo/keto reductase